jgi:hypothetical protein
MKKTIDYEIILKKYIRYIKEIEGSDFIENNQTGRHCDVKFSSAEWVELCRLSNLINN